MRNLALNAAAQIMTHTLQKMQSTLKLALSRAPSDRAMAEPAAPPPPRHDSLNLILQSPTLVEKHVKAFYGGIAMMVSSLCNANCIFCAYQYNEDKKEVMSLESFVQYFDKVAAYGYVGTVVFTPVAGEPLVDNTLFEKMTHARSKGVEMITVATNGILLNKNDNYKKLIDHGLDLIVVSISRLEKDIYLKIYRNSNYDKVVSGLFNLLDYKRSQAAKTRIMVSICALDVPEEEVWHSPDMHRLRDYIDDGTATLQMGSELDNWSGHITQDQLFGSMVLKEPRKPEAAPPCARLIHDMAVMPTGKVRVCSCRYWQTVDDELVIGDLNTDTMADMHFGERHLRLLADCARGNWPRACQNCTIYQPFDMPNLSDEDLAQMISPQESNA